jgi:hypothetical protein
MRIIFGMVGGFLIGGLPWPFAALISLMSGGNVNEVFSFLVITPFAAIFGGIVGMRLASKQPKRTH